MTMRIALALIALVTLAGCTAVPQYKRGHLAKRHMAFHADSDEAVLENHLIGAREAASGASGARGGGCGCY
jgi:hypothetical protein